MSTQSDKIKKLVSELDTTTLLGSKALDSAVQSISNFTSWQSVIDRMVKDCATYNGHYEDFLKDQCGIILDNDDLGAITGADAGGYVVKNAASVVPESGDWAYPANETTSVINGLTVNYPRKSTLNSAQQWIVGALDSWWIKSALDLINDSYGINFNESGTTVTSITVQFENSANNSLLAYVEYERKQKNTKLTLTINNNKYRNIDQNNVNGDSPDAPIYLDRTIAHEMTHAVMSANIDYFYELPALFTEGVAELTHGIDDQRKAYIIDLASNSAKLKSTLSTKSTSSLSAIGYAGGYMLLRYLAKQAANNRNPDTDVIYNADVDDEDTSTTLTYSAVFSEDQKTLTISGNFPDDVWLDGVNSLTGGDSAYENYTTVTIDARAMTTDHFLAGNNNDNVIRAGTRGSTLWGGYNGNDTLYGGDGRDFFWYNDSDGNDVIRNFTAGSDSTADVIVFANKSYGTVTRAMGTVTFAKDNGTLRANVGTSVDEAVMISFNDGDIRGVKIGNTNWDNTLTYDDKTSEYLGGNGQDTLKIDGDGQKNIWLNVDNAFNSIEHIDASSSNGANILVGSFDNSVIRGGNGDSTLWGGGGSDDTLIGGGGSEMFYYLYDDGNDVIENVGANDVINLLNIPFDLAHFSGVWLEDKTITFEFRNHQTLKFTSVDDDVTVQLPDSSRWTFNHSSKSWRT